jgi:hypothetical protein
MTLVDLLEAVRLAVPGFHYTLRHDYHRDDEFVLSTPDGRSIAGVRVENMRNMLKRLMQWGDEKIDSLPVDDNLYVITLSDEDNKEDI